MPEKTSFTQVEIATAINNALVMARNASTLGEIPDTRITKLRLLMQGLLEPLDEFLEEELIRPEEIVWSLLAGALFAQSARCMGKHTVPKGTVSQEVLKAVKLLLDKEK